MQRLSAFDAGFLALETDSAPLHLGALLVLEGPRPDLDVLRAELVGRASLVQPCRQRVRRRGLRHPVWADDLGFDPGRQVHIAHVGPSTDGGTLRRRVVELMSVRLDTSRPLWEVWLVEGPPGDEWALLVKAHHTLIDGVSGSGLLSALLSPPDPVALRPPGAAPAPERTALRERLRLLRQGVRTVAVPDLPASALNGPLGAGRTWDWLARDLADLDVVADRCGCSINDVYLAALCGGLRSALADHGLLSPATRVRVLVPVSMRRDLSDLRAGNLDAAFFVELPLRAGSVRDMLDDITVQTARAKADRVPLATEALLRAGDFVPTPVLDGAARAYARRGQRRVNLVASDVRGPGEPLQLCGRAVREIVPCLPLALDVRITSALMSYAGRACISITADPAGGVDADILVASIADALAELLPERG